MAPKRKARKASSTSKRPKVDDSKPSIKQIYQDCVTESDLNNLRRNLFEAEERGFLREIVWPTLCKLNESDSEWFQACFLTAVLISWEHREGSTTTALDFVQDRSTAVWTRLVDTLCQAERTDLEYRTSITHFLTVAWAVVQARNELQEGLLPHLTGLHLWHWMPTRRRELEIKRRADIDWESVTKPKEQPFSLKIIHQILYLLEGDTLKLGRKSSVEDEDDDDQDNEVKDVQEKLEYWIFLHRALEFLIDLLLSVRSRVHLVPYLDAIHFSVRCRMALGVSYFSRADENMFLSQQLLERIYQLIHFPMEDEKPLSKVDMLSLYHRRGTTLQKMCHRYYEEQLPGVIYAGVGMLCSGSKFLREAFGGFPDNDLLELLHKMRLVDKDNGGQQNYSREFLLQVLEEYLTLPKDPLEELQNFPLYPTESVLWDFSRIPPSHSSLLPASHVLSLPKLQAHFLSYADYLLRNFELARLESAYEIRSDLVDVVRRIRPLLRQSREEDANENEVMVLKTEFSGWARMALELDGMLRITKVAKPLLGHKFPAQVEAEISIDLAPCGDSIRREWDELGEYDNLFLVAIDASKMTGQQAPLMSEYHLHHGNHQRWDTDSDRRVPDADDRTFPERFGVTAVRGCMILQVRDEEGSILSDPSSSIGPSGTKRIYRVALDPAQYAFDSKSPTGTDVYRTMNLVVRRHGRENNFKSVLETIRGLMAGTGSISRVIPSWLQPLLLGQGDPQDAHYKTSNMKEYAKKTVGVANPNDPLDFVDTFLDASHLRESFPGAKVTIDGKAKASKSVSGVRHNYRARMIEPKGRGKPTLDATSYEFSTDINGNPVPFTPVQVEAIRSGLSPGLTMVVGPPGTGKTDVAVQIIASLYHSFPTQRTVIITHSNAALNDIFQKVMARGDVDERYLIRLGSGQRDLQTESTHDFTKVGRVAYSLDRRGKLLEKVQLLSESLGLSGRAERGADGSPAYTCETAEYFDERHVLKRVRVFEKKVEEDDISEDDNVSSFFPFASYFEKTGKELTLAEARQLFLRLRHIFEELKEYRPLELLRTQRQRSDYLIMKQARVVAMTCTHAAIARSHLIELGFEYDNVVVEEAGQMTEIESFIPLLLQKGEADDCSSGLSRLKRVCLIGDHNQLPPVIKNMSFAKYSNLDQSLFSRLIHLGVPYIQLDKQGRARPEIASLYSWRYNDLGNLDHVSTKEEFCLANPGLALTFQVINVKDFQGKGEIAPTAYFYQNVGEAEYAVALFQYMVLIGYSPSKISILTTYNGQKELISDILSQRCGEGTPLAGVRPRAVSTVDQYQGQQNDYVLLSLVRTESVGHLRDIRRLVVAVSRARLGLYVFCRQELFAGCHELKRTFDQFADISNKLQLVMGENYPCERKLDDKIPKKQLFEVDDVEHMGSIVHQMQEDWMASQQS